MEPQTKRIWLTTFLCLLIMIGWMKLQAYLYPPRPPASQPAATEPAAVAPSQPAERPTASAPGSSTVAAAPPSATTNPASAGEYVVADAFYTATATLGGDQPDLSKVDPAWPYDMSVVVTPVGGSIESLLLTRHLKVPPKSRNKPADNRYPLLQPIEDTATHQTYYSFATESVRLVQEKALVPLDTAVWSLSTAAVYKEQGAGIVGEEAMLQTRIRHQTAQPTGGTSPPDVLEITKTYLLTQRSPFLRVSLRVRNLTPSQQGIIVTQRGPVGIEPIEPQKDITAVVAAVIEPETGKVSTGGVAKRPDVLKKEGLQYELLPGEGYQRLWAAVGNKYFCCIVTPLANKTGASYPDYFAQLFGKVLVKDRKQLDDLTLEAVFKPEKTLEPAGSPGDTVTWEVEVYCGAKDRNVFDALPAAERARRYELVSAPDLSSCTFEPLPSVMRWLLNTSYKLVGNYGVAIIILVIIVRLALHPISRRGQASMIKMQKGMARLKPKLEAIQQQYKNDKQRLSEETQKIYKEEGISPLGPVFGCLPMFLQMPIWVALWATLNTDVHLRHQPFCLWMSDLSSPDALVSFSTPFNIPLLSYVMGPVYALNLLPIIMTITMYAQQKLTQKMTKAGTPPTPPPVDKDGNPVPDQTAQQQKMMNFMTLFFGLLFYNFPSGLNLYILSSNILGMGEQYIIKRELRKREERGELFVKKAPKPPGKPSLFSRYATMIEKKVEQARQVQSDRARQDSDKRGGKPRG
jgi:YidC/Oxa1 family membrane protein insertase